jgi:hypothetical protein
MKAVILVPYSRDGADRELNWNTAHAEWMALGWPVYTGTSEPFDRTRARNDAARRAGDWEVALFADADIILDSLSQAYKAVTTAYEHGWYTVAYSKLHYLSEQGTLDACLRKPLFYCEQSDPPVSGTWEAASLCAAITSRGGRFRREIPGLRRPGGGFLLRLRRSPGGAH